MRIIYGLELRPVPVEISSHPTRPFDNAPFDLKQRMATVSMSRGSRPKECSDRTTVSVIAMSGMGIGEKFL